MNKANNKRSRSTDEAIIRAAFAAMVEGKKPVSKITVREICERAGVNRSTFYAHYLDVYDLFEQVEKHMAGMLKEELQAIREWSFQGAIETVFAFIYEYREFFGLYFKDINQVANLLQVLIEPFSEQIKQLKSQEPGQGVQDETAYRFNFFTAGISAIIACWLENGCRETPAQLYGVLEREYGRDSLFNTWSGRKTG